MGLDPLFPLVCIQLEDDTPVAKHQAPSVLTILALSLLLFLHECEHACGATFGWGQAPLESVPGLIQD